MIVENSMHIFLLYVILPPFSFDSPISKIELFSFDSPIWVDILGIVWTASISMQSNFSRKRLVYVYDNIETEDHN